MGEFSMNMYKILSNDLIDFEYTGEVVNFVRIKNRDINITDKMERYLLTTLEKRKDDYLMNLYYQGERVYGKRFDKNKTITIESHKLIVSYTFEIMEREYERARVNQSKDKRVNEFN